MLHLLADETLPDNMFQVVMGPIGAAFFGLAIFYLGLWAESRGRKAPWRWVALLPLAIGLFLGGSVFYKWLTNPVYTDIVASGALKKMTVAHWAAFFIPLVCFLAVVLYRFYKDRVNLVPED